MAGWRCGGMAGDTLTCDDAGRCRRHTTCTSPQTCGRLRSPPRAAATAAPHRSTATDGGRDEGRERREEMRTNGRGDEESQ